MTKTLILRKPKKVNVKLVVKGNDHDLLQFQNYLDQSRFEVIEARTVTKGIFEYRRRGVILNGLDEYQDNLQRLLQDEFPQIKLRATIYPLKDEDDELKRAYMELSFSGPLLQLFPIREYIFATEGEHKKSVAHSIIFLR